MKYRILAVICILACFLFGGCAFWMDGEHLSITPHQAQSVQPGTDIIEVANYSQVRNVLIELVESGADSGIVSAASFNSATAHHYVSTAVTYVKNYNPIAAYAVNDINYEIGTNRGNAVIAFQIDYQRGCTPVPRIKHVNSMEEAKNLIMNALDDCADSIVLNIEHYSAIDFKQFVQDYGNTHPDTVMEIPQVNVGVYPESGNERVVALELTYQTKRDDLKDMQEQVQTVFTSADLYVEKTAQVSDIYSRLYSFLMERNDYKLETSITPSYSLLHYGVGDSRAFANVYAQMCRRAELDCQVISGTRDGTAWSWNLVRFRGKYYHVDLLRCFENGKFQMCNATEMSGYVWDYTAYP